MLYQWESEVANILSLFKKFKQIPLKIKFMEEYLKDLKVKFEAMRFIINFNNKNFIVKFLSKNSVNELIKRYNNCKDIDINILKKLTNLSNISQDSQDITKEALFLQNFENKTRDRDLLFRSFVDFPVIEDNHEIYLAHDFKHVWGKGKKEKDFLNEAITRYNNTLGKAPNDVLKEVYGKIIELINIIQTTNDH